MAINFNGTNIDKIIYNGTTLDKVIFNGVVVWESIKPLVMDATGIEGAIQIVFRNPNKYEANVTVYLDYDYSQEWNVKVPANGEKELVIDNLSAGGYEVLVGYSINGKSFNDYAEVQVSERFKYTRPELTVSTDSSNNDFVFRIQNKNTYELLVTIAVEGEYYCNYQKIQANGLSTIYDYISNGYESQWVNIEVSYYKTDKTLIETYNFDYFVPMLPETTTTTTYALGEPTSTEGNFKYYQGGKNARPINK